MKEDSDRVFDVSKPHRASPDATSRPVIVGHHPVASDPMVKTETVPLSPVPSEHRNIPVFAADENEVQLVPGPPAVTSEHPESVVAVAPEPREPAADEQPPAFNEQAPEAPDFAAMANESPTADAPLTYAEAPTGDQHAMSHGAPENNFAPAQHPEESKQLQELAVHQPSRKHGPWIKVLLVLILLLVAGYLAIDSRLIKTSIKLPFHVFKQPAPAVYTPPVQSQQNTSASSVPVVPSGFTNYILPNTTIGFDYPTVWGVPTTTTEGGFSSRSTSAQSDGTYAYLTSFATNKGVQIAVTSSKYLPPVRTTPLYYDYLQWCVGTNDGLFYSGILRFNATNGVDTPSTVTCDQGPLTGATKLDSSTIVQLKTTNPDGSALGDLYTKNLDSTSLPVLRVKDATSSNGVEIKQLLNTVDATSPTT